MTEDEKVELRAWATAKSDLDKAKVIEKELRDKVIGMFFKIDRSGTQKQNINNTHRLSFSQPVKNSINKEKFAEKKAQLEMKGLIGEGKLFKLEPKLDGKAFKYITDEDKKILGDMIEEGFGSPSIKVEEIK